MILKTIIENNSDVLNISGPYEKNLAIIDEMYNCQVYIRGEQIFVDKDDDNLLSSLDQLFSTLLQISRRGINLQEREIIYLSKLEKKGLIDKALSIYENRRAIITNHAGRSIYPVSLAQKDYVKALANNDLVFGIGPAGTGKTYIAVLFAVSMLKENKIKKIILTRPAVEAGESLGFLPGDLKEKVDPYLTPLYDALHEVLGLETVNNLIERGVIEIAPLAYMRGRTLENAYVILDEAQNTTEKQMKMFLTRLGFSSKMIVTGDITQIDLPRGVNSGLKQAVRMLRGEKGIGVVEFDSLDVVRHPLVQKILEKYEMEE